VTEALIAAAELFAQARDDYRQALVGYNLAYTSEQQDIFWAEMQAARARMALALKDAKLEQMAGRRAAC